MRTRRRFPASAGAVWPLLCDSRIEGSSRVLSLLHLPQPIRCRLVGGSGGVGEERECQSDQGVVRQRILEWVPERRLAFRMEGTTLAVQRWIEGMVDTLDLDPQENGLVVTRTTRVQVRGPLRLVKGWLLFLGLKQVHRVVFRGWLRSVRSSSERT